MGKLQSNKVLDCARHKGFSPVALSIRITTASPTFRGPQRLSIPTNRNGHSVEFVATGRTVRAGSEQPDIEATATSIFAFVID
jgi:hypothetical protein